MTMILDGTLGITATGSLTGLTTPITAAQGGTGAATLTANNVLLGNGTSAVTFVAPSTSGNLLTSNGTTWASTAPAAAGGMTLLGTITITGSNSVSLGSLTLTSYKALFMSIINIDNGGVRSYISSSNVQSGGGIMIPTAMSGSPIYGTLWLDLASGSVGGAFSDPNVGSNYTRFAWAGGFTNVSTSTTTIYFRNEGASNYGSGASIKIFGVA